MEKIKEEKEYMFIRVPSKVGLKMLLGKINLEFLTLEKPGFDFRFTRKYFDNSKNCYVWGCLNESRTSMVQMSVFMQGNKIEGVHCFGDNLTILRIDLDNWLKEHFKWLHQLWISGTIIEVDV